jgi:hypothetical protein
MIMMVKPEYVALLLICPRSRESFKKKLANAQTFPIPFLFVLRSTAQEMVNHS